jgi:hypothetical protein
MKAWPKYPMIYEINTWVWLDELSRKYNQSTDLSTVPSQEWDLLSSFGFDAVWLMGVWERSPAGAAIANQNKDLLDEFRRTLSDFQPQDNVGSAYCVRQYVVDSRLGGPGSLAQARRELAQRGLRLILDFVPNHVAPDHPWVTQHPKYFVPGDANDVQRDPAAFLETGGHVFARGRAYNDRPWPEVLQLNAFEPELRQAVIRTLSDIAGQCDGVRCDMSMLFLNSTFQGAWGWRVAQRPATEYWSDVIPAVKNAHPDFLFVAEAYADEWTLQQQGFDYCYDGCLYGRLGHDTAKNVRLHLCAQPAYQNKLVRYIENHDEPRALAAFCFPKERAAAVTMATIPGAKLFHEGQFEGRKTKVPVFLRRRPAESVNAGVQAFYRTLLQANLAQGLRDDTWQLCERSGWPENTGFENLVAWCWRSAGERHLVVVNLSDRPAQGRVRLPWNELAGKTWQVTDLFTQQKYDRGGDEMCNPGLYVDLPPWGFHILTQWQAH